MRERDITKIFFSQIDRFYAILRERHVRKIVLHHH